MLRQQCTGWRLYRHGTCAMGSAHSRDSTPHTIYWFHLGGRNLGKDVGSGLKRVAHYRLDDEMDEGKLSIHQHYQPAAFGRYTFDATRRFQANAPIHLFCESEIAIRRIVAQA